MPETLLGINPLTFAYFLVALIAGLTIHETAHALVADWLGDPTASGPGLIGLVASHF